MRFGKWRGVSLALALAAVVGLGLTSTVRADGWHLHPTLPDEVPAYDYTTGGEYFAPPVPYGHYAKDYAGGAAKAAGFAHGTLKDLWDKTVGLFHGAGHGCGDGCGAGCGSGHGHGRGLGHGCNESGDGGNGCGFCAGRGLFHHGDGGSDSAIGGHGIAGHLGHGSTGGGHAGGHGLGHKKNFAPCHASTVTATSQVQPAPQAVVTPSAQGICGDPGCKVAGRHSHLANLASKIRCKLCGGGGCGACGGAGLGDPCSGCGGLGHGGAGGACGACGGCGLFNHGLGHGGTGCSLCGGRGCANCLKGLASKAHGFLGSLAGLLHHQKFDYFVGPGGPVPLTPGYVPYIVTTRSPRDFLSFPPMNPNDP
jgi:hypothetical protein